MKRKAEAMLRPDEPLSQARKAEAMLRPDEPLSQDERGSIWKVQINDDRYLTRSNNRRTAALFTRLPL